MEVLIIQTAAIISIASAGVFFMAALITGAWKYACMMNSPEFKAPYYVDVAHRSALLYAFAALLIGVFANLSAFKHWINILATIPPLLFFAIAIAKYITLGLENKTNNALRDSANPGLDKLIMGALMLAEIGGFSILLMGFFARILL